MKIVSYNLNGIRASFRLGLSEWIKEFDADIYCFQEVRANESICKSLLNACSYHAIYNCGNRAGYAGTIILCKKQPLKIEYGMGDFDTEGRTILIFYDNLVIVNSYVPNGTNRLEYKIEYFEKLITYLDLLSKTQNVILCSDTNIAHSLLDVSHPKENNNRSGYLPVERELKSKLLDTGFIDTYRYFNPDIKAYSWRSYKSRIIGGDFGWKFRFDYIITNKNNINAFEKVEILDLDYSDHLPVVATIKSRL